MTVKFKLSKSEKIIFDDLRNTYKMHGYTLAFETDEWDGSTVLYVTHPSFGNYMRVAVAFCGRNNEYNRKRGKFEALNHYESGNFITVPKTVEVAFLQVDNDD